MSDTETYLSIRKFPAKLWRRFRARALETGMSTREALILALSRYLEEDR